MTIVINGIPYMRLYLYFRISLKINFKFEKGPEDGLKQRPKPVAHNK